jgi:vanillate O-demethylase monooxygenase subunit
MTAFLRNAWYVVAWDHEIPADDLFTRTVIGEPLLLFRSAGGSSPWRIAAAIVRRRHRDTICRSGVSTA